MSRIQVRLQQLERQATGGPGLIQAWEMLFRRFRDEARAEDDPFFAASEDALISEAKTFAATGTPATIASLLQECSKDAENTTAGERDN